MKEDLKACAPALLLLIFTFGPGTFAGAADGAWTIFGHALLLFAAAAAGRGWRDPLRLGDARLVLVGVFLVVLLSWYQSPTPRAGRVALFLLPVYLFLPSAFAKCWRSARARAIGVSSLAFAGFATAIWALFAWRKFAAPGASAPLGHHNLLAAWLVGLLPIAALFAVRSLREVGIRRRVIASMVVAVMLAALFASRSLSGALVLIVSLFFAAIAAKGRSRVAAWGAAALVVLTLLLPANRARWTDLASWSDSSTQVRQVYWEAALRGAGERPWLGWGPGAAAWTFGEHVRLDPALFPPGHVSSDPHGLFARFAYELGLLGTGSLLVLAAVFARRRIAAVKIDAESARAADFGLGAMLLISLAGRPFAAPALLLVATALLGLRFAAEEELQHDAPAASAATVFWMLLTAWLVAPYDLAHLQATRAGWETPEQRARFLDAARRDPEFPLYRLQAAAVRKLEGDDEEAAQEARIGIRGAPGVGPLWIAAGVLTSDGEAIAALTRASELDPFSPLVPALLARIDPERRASHQARALRLQAASGVVGDEGELWVAELDGEASSSVSLHVFRRRPHRLRLAALRLSDP